MADSWARLTTFGNEAYHAMWAPTLLFELIVQLGMIVFGILIVILFFRGRSSVPRIYIGFQLIACAQLLIDWALVQTIPQAATTASNGPGSVGALIGTIIWVGYFLTSLRVRNTFVVRRDKSAKNLPVVPREAFSL